MDERILVLLQDCNKKPGASKSEISELKMLTENQLPKSYIELLAYSNGIEGPVGAASYLALWPAEEIGELNKGYAVDEFAPGIFLIGSDGGNTGFGFDTRSEAMPLVEVPLVGMSIDEIEVVGETLREFLEHLQTSQ